MQFIISPRDHGLLKRYRRALEKVREGTRLKTATNIKTGFAGFLIDLFASFKKVAPENRIPADDPRLKNIEQKVSSPIFQADIRIVASAPVRERAEVILEDIEAPFKQFEDTAGNRLVFSPVPVRGLRTFAHAFSYRLLDESSAMPLSGAELATLAHLPQASVGRAAPELKQDKGNTAPPPLDLPQTGTLIGVSRFRGDETKIFIQPEDRLRHLYLIGQTGTGKSGAAQKYRRAGHPQRGRGMLYRSTRQPTCLIFSRSSRPTASTMLSISTRARPSGRWGSTCSSMMRQNPSRKRLLSTSCSAYSRSCSARCPRAWAPPSSSTSATRRFW